MRTRLLRPGFFSNEDLAEIPLVGRVLFQGMWCLADREGRLEDRPRRIKGQVLPYDDCDAEAMTAMLAERGFILRYEVGGIRYIQITSFVKHQSPHKTEAASTIPAPVDYTLPNIDPELLNGELTVNSTLDTGSLTPSLLVTSNLLLDTSNTDVRAPVPLVDNFKPFVAEFWRIYPPRNGKQLNKGKAEAILKRLYVRDGDDILIAVANYAASANVRAGYAKDAFRFLEANGWKEWMTPEIITIGEKTNGTKPTGNKLAAAARRNRERYSITTIEPLGGVDQYQLRSGRPDTA